MCVNHKGGCMNILPISRALSFTGKEVLSKTLSYDNIRKMPEYHPSSTIETTIGWNHKIPRERVYFAEPMEPVSEALKRNVDYVVYDNEPKYPELEDIRKNYLEHNRTNYREKFEEIREYFYRREMGGFANVEEAKDGQRKAAECTGFYDRAGDLRYKKETTEDEILKLKRLNESIQQGIGSTEKEITSQQLLKKTLEKHIENLEKTKTPYNEFKKAVQNASLNEDLMYTVAEKRINDIESQKEYEKQLENTAYYYEGEAAAQQNAVPAFDKYAKTTKNFDSLCEIKNAQGMVNKTFAEKQSKAIQATIDRFVGVKNGCEATIKEMQAYIAELKVKSAGIDSQILFKKAFIEDCKSQLSVHFEQLKKFYTENIIKLAKK